MHTVEIVEHGPFASAVCSCGWRSFARRSRTRARTEAAAHLAQPGG